MFKQGQTALHALCCCSTSCIVLRTLLKCNFKNRWILRVTKEIKFPSQRISSFWWEIQLVAAYRAEIISWLTLAPCKLHINRTNWNFLAIPFPVRSRWINKKRELSNSFIIHRHHHHYQYCFHFGWARIQFCALRASTKTCVSGCCKASCGIYIQSHSMWKYVKL